MSIEHGDSATPYQHADLRKTRKDAISKFFDAGLAKKIESAKSNEEKLQDVINLMIKSHDYYRIYRKNAVAELGYSPDMVVADYDAEKKILHSYQLGESIDIPLDDIEAIYDEDNDVSFWQCDENNNNIKKAI